MLAQYRREAPSYWEKRRVIFNLLLIPAGWLGYSISASFTYNIDDREPASFSDPQFLIAVIMMGVMANVCYSMVYMIEFIFMSEKKGSFWPSPGRTLLLIAGCLIGMFFALSNMGHLEKTLAGPPIPGKF
ncbi:MAG: hypothetical protein ACI8UO_003741 [Verrucomicrobiales bacterium]|jgi:hypothetical protein